MKTKIFRMLGFFIGFALILVAMINGWEEWRRGAFSILYLLNACVIGSIFVIYGLFGEKNPEKKHPKSRAIITIKGISFID